MRALVGPALVVTIFGVGVHATTFVIQILIARSFGAGDDIDAYFAAMALPQYLASVLAVTLPVAFIPALATHSSSLDDIHRATVGLVAISALITGGVVIACVAFAVPLLRTIAPGLSSVALAAGIASIAWPAVIASSATSLLTAAYQARSSFARPAAAALTGGLTNLILVFVLIGRWGVWGVAAAGTISVFLQALLLVPPFLRTAHLRNAVSHPAVHTTMRMFVPLALSALLVKSSVIVERYLASELSAGSIAHVAYATRIVALLAFLLSTGISTVFFPGLARRIASGDLPRSSAHLSTAIRAMWVFVAPAIAVGFVISTTAIQVLLQAGRFTPSDTLAVSALVRIYLFSLIATCLGTITGRALYALQLAKTMAVAGAAEAVLYIGYTTVLMRSIGISGVAWGFVIYNTVSLTWQTLLLGRRIGWSEPGTSTALLRTSAAAVLAAAAALGALFAPFGPAPRLVLALLTAIPVYFATLAAISRPDALLLLKSWRQMQRYRVTSATDSAEPG